MASSRRIRFCCWRNLSKSVSNRCKTQMKELTLKNRTLSSWLPIKTLLNFMMRHATRRKKLKRCNSLSRHRLIGWDNPWCTKCSESLRRLSSTATSTTWDGSSLTDGIKESKSTSMGCQRVRKQETTSSFATCLYSNCPRSRSRSYLRVSRQRHGKHSLSS